MIGLTPCLPHAWKSSTEPFMTPWSVSPSAGMPSSAARAAIASILLAPSSREYSLWTCRCAACWAGVVLTGPSWQGGWMPTGPRRAVPAAISAFCGTLRSGPVPLGRGETPEHLDEPPLGLPDALLRLALGGCGALADPFLAGLGILGGGEPGLRRGHRCGEALLAVGDRRRE